MNVVVRCWGHIDSQKKYFHVGYFHVHEFSHSDAVRMLEYMSKEDWENGPRCMIEVNEACSEEV